MKTRERQNVYTLCVSHFPSAPFMKLIFAAATAAQNCYQVFQQNNKNSVTIFVVPTVNAAVSYCARALYKETILFLFIHSARLHAPFFSVSHAAAAAANIFHIFLISKLTLFRFLRDFCNFPCHYAVVRFIIETGNDNDMS
jgi:hypothetical protein